MAKAKVFLDSSVLIAAILSSKGGSFYILDKFDARFEFLINEYIFQEVTEVLDKKFTGRDDLRRKLFLLLGIAPIKIVTNPLKREVRLLGKIINVKDAPILSSALTHSSYLITLDDDFLDDNVIKFTKKKGLIILKPKEFIQQYIRL